ncbi:MAG: DUF2219 family protein [Brevundimonas sp.]|nr:MAG: DUF2219 family protein [Brevundimonas sp.]
MLWKSCLVGLGAATIASAASAQTWLAGNWDAVPTDEAVTVQLNRQSAFNAEAGRDFGPALEYDDGFGQADRDADPAFAANTRQDVWVSGEGYSERWRLRTTGELRRADGGPLPLTPLQAGDYRADNYDVSYIRGWQGARGYTASGLEVSLTPHAGLGFGSRGPSAEAGATLRIGSGVERIAPDGRQAFGDRPRWYLYAAGSGRAVGYNFARTRDGDYAGSGYSHDSGSFLGDASIGVAWRRGDVQSSFGLVYREIEPEGLRRGRNFDRDVDEGLVAFQLSIKPES